MTNKFVTGYADRDFVGQFFRRNIQAVIPQGVYSEKPEVKLPDNEVNYVVEQLVATAFFPYDEHLGSPWSTLPVKKMNEYLKLSVPNEDILLEAKKMADKILVIEGIVRYGGVQNISGESNAEKFAYISFGSRLYNQSSTSKRLNENERVVLKGMSRHLPVWVNVLSQIRGRDAFEIMMDDSNGRFS